MQIDDINEGAIITRQELEKMGATHADYFGKSLIFKKDEKRILWNPQTQSVDYVYSIKEEVFG